MSKTSLGLLLIVVIAAGVVIANVVERRGDRTNDSQAASDLPQSPAEESITQRTEKLTPPATTVRVPLPDPVFDKKLDSPGDDGWVSEAIVLNAKKQLDRLAALIMQPNRPDTSQLGKLACDRFAADPLAPTGLETVYEDKVTIVEQAASLPPAVQLRSASPPQQVRLEQALRPLTRPFSKARDIECEFKIIDIDVEAGLFRTETLLHLSGQLPTGMREVHATWIITWQGDHVSPAPQFESIRLTSYQRAETRHAPGPLFVDCTDSIIGAVPAYHEQLSRGLNHWLQRMQAVHYHYNLGTPGIALGDVNGDGLDDLYLCQEEGLPNRLFLQRPDGTLQDVSRAWGVDWANDCRAPLLIDLDNDGDQDLAMTTVGGILLARNDNGERFQFQTVLAMSDDVMSLSAADYDQDGDLDLYACVYYEAADSRNTPDLIPSAAAGFIFHDANNGGRNSLFQNDGQGNFVDVTAETGMDENNHRFSYAAAWEDFDNDGDQDLYVANDHGRNALYRNDSGSFTDIAGVSNSEDRAAGMSVAWADFDRNGFRDLYIANMFSAAGSRIAHHEQFKQSATPEVRQALQRFARGNTLLKNVDGKSFQDVSILAGVARGRWAWSSNFVDLNNDGWEDLVVANGYITTEDTGDL